MIRQKLHKCTINSVVDLTGTLNKKQIKLLSKGTGYIPKSNALGYKNLKDTCDKWQVPYPDDDEKRELFTTKCGNDVRTLQEIKTN